MIVIAHLSDIHIDSSPRSAERTRAVMAYLESLHVDLDAVVVTGDIADHGLESEYARVRELLRTRHPLLVCPGNHDRRDAFREVLLGAPPAARPGTPVNQVLRRDGFVLALCDSSVPGEDEGFLADETLDWLDGVLDETPDGVPVLVGFHHPPTALGMPFVDGIRQFGEDRLAERTASRPGIAAFLCGHAHTAAATTFAGRPLLVAPGVISSSKLPWEPYEHPNDHVYRDEMAPSLAFHVLDEGRITTHFRSVPLREPVEFGRAV
ncbi:MULTISPECIES: metallophosphoesterase [Streptomyces]|uniref:metallophosphoesterase n=1 Tax=Streptomyces TaxID=1883 RepID=UPI0013163DFB|nr:MULTISPECIES: metallophosphoesterase [Streptomyces]QGZ52707.1 phosphodiesterase [Streptomyces sp. QHH-9511]